MIGLQLTVDKVSLDFLPNSENLLFYSGMTN